MPPIATLRDNFTDSSIATAWVASTLGSATATETSGQARFTLPSSTAGTHLARYTSHLTYDLTAGSFYINIDTMVSTSVAATAFFQLYFGSGANTLNWNQVSGTLKATSIVAGVSTDQYSVAWNASTYKYLRIRESGGNIEWHSSSNGTTWTLRATLATPFTITDLSVDFGATCGNVASPGSFRLEDANIILPALSTTWRWQQALWPFFERNRNTTIAIDAAGTAQGYLVTADGVDVNGDPTGNVRYHSGPADGGRVLTEQSSQAAAEAMAVDLPLDGRFDLASQVEARCYRLYSRSVDGAAFTIREFYPRRLVQADDIEAESIRALHIASASITGDRIVAGTITADLITVDELAALAIDTGSLSISGVISIAAAGGIYQGTGSFASPTTGLKIYNSGGIGKISGYNGGVEQVSIGTDGRLKAANGNFIADVDSVRILADSSPSDARAYAFISSGAAIIGGLYGTYSSGDASLLLAVDGISGGDADIDITAAGSTGAPGSVTITASNDNGAASSSMTIFGAGLAGFTDDVGVAGDIDVGGGINVGTATGAATGQVRGSGYLMASGAGALPAFGVLAIGYDTGTPRGLLVAIDNGTYKRLDIEAIDLRLKYQSTNRVQINATGIGFFTATPVAQPAVGAAAPAGGTGATAGAYDTAANRNALITLVNNMRTAGINLGLWSL